MVVSPPDRTDPPSPAYAPRLEPSPLVHAKRLVPLVAAGLVMELGWVLLWVLSYRLTHGNDFTYTYLTTYDWVWEHLYDLLQVADRLFPGIEPPQSVEILLVPMVVGFALVAVGYVAALVLLDRGLATSRWALGLIIGYVLLFQATLVSMPGVYTTDIFSYMMYGHISEVYGLNPYIFPPAAFPGNPLLGWIHPIWHNTPSVYGPLWTDLAWVFTRLIEPLALFHQVFAYKALMNLAFLADLALVWWLLARVLPGGGTRHARVAAFALFAWNPMMLFEVVGNAHNDGLMVSLLLLGVVPLVAHRSWRLRIAGLIGPHGGRRGVRGPLVTNLGWLMGVVLVGLSALVKYTTGIVGFFYLVAWTRRLQGWSARLTWAGASVAASALVALLLFWPWLKLPEVLQPVLDAAGGSMYTNSIPDLVALSFADQVLDTSGLHEIVSPTPYQDTARFWMKIITRAAFLGYLVWEARRVWRASGAGPRAALDAVLTASVRAFLVLLLLVLTWVLGWYFTWPLALATLLGWRRTITRVTVGYTLLASPVFYVHHYLSWHTPGTLLLVYGVPPLLIPIGEWVWVAIRSKAAGVKLGDQSLVVEHQVDGRIATLPATEHSGN